MTVTITPTKADGCKAKLIALRPEGSLYFSCEDAKTVRVTISARIKPDYPLREYKTKKMPGGILRVLRLKDIVLEPITA